MKLTRYVDVFDVSFVSVMDSTLEQNQNVFFSLAVTAFRIYTSPDVPWRSWRDNWLTQVHLANPDTPG